MKGLMFSFICDLIHPKTCVCHGAARFYTLLYVWSLSCRDALQDAFVQSVFDDMQLIMSTHAVSHQPDKHPKPNTGEILYN